ncbi:MAG: hypothetical protein AAFU49_04195 [Pseudomonadota bacterium]
MKTVPSIAFALATVSAVGLSAATPSGPARAQTPADIASAEAAFDFLQQLGIRYAVLAARTAIDLTYESVSIDPRNNAAVLNGVTLRPRLDWDPERQCEIRIERLATAGTPTLDLLQSTFEIAGASVPAVCLDPGTGAMLSSFGYPVLEVSRASIAIAYDMPSSGANLFVSADIADAAEVTVTSDFDYVYVTGILDEETGGEPIPVAKLSTAEVVLENAGLWERVSPMLGAQVGDLQQLPAMVGPMLGSMLAAPGQPIGAAEQALIDNLSTELARFLETGDRLVLSSQPEGGVWLSEDTFSTPQAAIAALQPMLSSAPLAVDQMVAADQLAAALAGGAGLDDASRLSVGEALITGIGAPRALTEGKALIAPLAEAWNGEAALLMGEAMADEGDAAGAYTMALRAQAGGAAGALGLTDTLEADLDAATVLAAQTAVHEGWPDLGAWQSLRAEAEQAGDSDRHERLPPQPGTAPRAAMRRPTISPRWPLPPGTPRQPPSATGWTTASPLRARGTRTGSPSATGRAHRP